MTPFAILLLAVVLIGNTAGQLLFKAASLRADRPGLAGHWQALALWQGVMVASIDILMVMLGGRIFFHEKITPSRVLAISLIAVGVLLVGGGGQ
jgi:drug/metabolite transporter (DMT)-like permease